MDLFLRAFLQVALVSLNVRFISQGAYTRAFVTGTLISLVWYWNVNTAAREWGIFPIMAYSLGAGCGTLAGMYLGRPLRSPQSPVEPL